MHWVGVMNVICLWGKKHLFKRLIITYIVFFSTFLWMKVIYLLLMQDHRSQASHVPAITTHIQ
jgi:hypothetical protein